MPVVNDKVGHRFTVDAVTGKKTRTDTYINILKRREDIFYRTSLPAASSNIAFVGSNLVSSDDNLSIADRSTSLPANRVSTVGFTSISGTKVFTINTENFVVTDIFADATQTITAQPLFYNHILNKTNLPRVGTGDLPADLLLAANTKLISVEILDQLMQPIKVPEFKIDETRGIIYNNLLSEYSSSADYTIYFVKYVVRDATNAVTTYVDLLDNQPTYRPATFDDLDGTLQIITDGRKVYLIEEIGGVFSITLPIVGDYAFQPLSSARIQVIPPVASSIDDSWFIRVTNGKFFTIVRGNLQKYYIAEFLSQSFNPEPPIKRRTDEKSAVMGRSLIKLDQENILQDDTLGLFVNIQVNDEDGNGLEAFTTNPSLEGIAADNGVHYKFWNPVNKQGIRSIDHRTGVVAIDGIELSSSYEIISSYYFEEVNFEFNFINFNPISNSDALKNRVVLFIDAESVAESLAQTLYFLIVNEAGRVIDTNWDITAWGGTLGTDDPLHNGVPMYYEATPDWPVEPTFPATGFEEIFIDKYTVEGPVSRSDDILVLADITVAEATDAAQTIRIDSRKRGGGIVEELLTTARELQSESKWYWDEGYWDGIPYPGNASYLVEVPIDLFEGAGGNFTQKDVKDIIDRHTAAGVYPVVKGYGIDILIDSVEVSPNSVTLRWSSNGY